MSLIKRFHVQPERVIFETVQDIEPILEENKFRREENGRGDFRHKWNLPTVMIHKFYYEYTAGEWRPMDNEFWLWVDKKLNDPDYAYFKTSNPSNPFHIGYRK